MSDGWITIFLIAIVAMAAIERDERGDRLQDDLAQCQALSPEPAAALARAEEG